LRAIVRAVPARSAIENRNSRPAARAANRVVPFRVPFHTVSHSSLALLCTIRWLADARVAAVVLRPAASRPARTRRAKTVADPMAAHPEVAAKPPRPARPLAPWGSLSALLTQ